MGACSIEIEGGREIPVLDGSAMGWAIELQFAGLRAAPTADQADKPLNEVIPMERKVVRPEKVKPMQIPQRDSLCRLAYWGKLLSWGQTGQQSLIPVLGMIDACNTKNAGLAAHGCVSVEVPTGSQSRGM